MFATPERRLRLWAIFGMVLIVLMAALRMQVLKNVANIFGAPSLLD